MRTAQERTATWVRVAGLVFAGTIIGCSDAPPPLAPTVPPPRTSVQALEGDRRPDTVLNRYVVVLRKDVPSAATTSAGLVAQVGGLRFYVYETALKGFAVANLPAGAAEALRRNPLVTLVEEDKLMTPLQSVQYFSAPADTGLYLLDRIDQRNLPLDWQYTYSYTGTNSHIYIIDSGVRGGHQEWTYSRIGRGAAFIKWSSDPSPTIDQLGHGTAVAGAAAGSVVGVAKQATIHSVRIDDGESGAYESDMIAGIDWVAGNAISPAVANLSYGHNSAAIGQAVSGPINAGVSFVTAAGNDYGADACDPTTLVPGAITVAATTVSDYRASYTNVGSCVDLFAPGGNTGGYYNGFGLLRLASNVGNSSYQYAYGTSFASPLVAGVAALILQQNPTLSPIAVEDALVQGATQNVIPNPGAGTPNRLLYSQVTVSPPPGSPPTPPSIQGRASVRPQSYCTWTMSPGTVPGPVSYVWYVDDILQSQVSEPLQYAAGSSGFRIELVTTDATGVRRSEYHDIRVSSSAPLCPV